jgi:hypothetical protein
MGHSVYLRFIRVPGPFRRSLILSIGVLASFLDLLEVAVRVSPCLDILTFLRCCFPPVPASLALDFFSFRLAYPDLLSLGGAYLPLRLDVSELLLQVC